MVPLLPDDASPALRQYTDLLLRWNRALNLISPRDVVALWQRHLADSLQLGGLWRARPAHAIDLGSGGGFPGLVLAIQWGIPFVLIEQDRAKATFLREAARVTGAPVTVVAEKIENAQVAPAPLITARALAPLPRLLDYAARLLLPGGECLLLKGSHVEDEIHAAEALWHMEVERVPSRTGHGVILRVTNIARR